MKVTSEFAAISVKGFIRLINIKRNSMNIKILLNISKFFYPIERLTSDQYTWF